MSHSGTREAGGFPGTKSMPSERQKRMSANTNFSGNRNFKETENAMIQPIMKDVIFLAQKSAPAQNCPEDKQVACDLLETLEAHKDGCVGMAANMIGATKRIIAFDNEGTYMVMFNPEIIKSSGTYEAEEGCLSLDGTRKTMRWKSIKVQFQNEQFQTRLKTFTGWTAQIIQHEIDHCNGILI